MSVYFLFFATLIHVGLGCTSPQEKKCADHLQDGLSCGDAVLIPKNMNVCVGAQQFPNMCCSAPMAIADTKIPSHSNCQAANPIVENCAYWIYMGKIKCADSMVTNNQNIRTCLDIDDARSGCCKPMAGESEQAELSEEVEVQLKEEYSNDNRFVLYLGATFLLTFVLAFFVYKAKQKSNSTFRTEHYLLVDEI